MHSLVRCDDISGSEGIAVELEDEVCSMSSSVSQEVVSTTRSQPEVEATNAIVGIITGGILVLVIQCVGYGERQLPIQGPPRQRRPQPRPPQPPQPAAPLRRSMRNRRPVNRLQL
nr:uncharacterized protein LOC117685237 isoform X1 [Crassostrea gigas]